MPRRRKKKSSEKPNAPESGITIRMYFPGFGDCFLLTFHTPNGEPRYVLIDCGVYPGYPEGQKRTKLVVRNIAEVTGGHLDIVAVTHEHADHISGFTEENFKDFQIDNLWLAWTEDPEDTLAKQLKDSIKKEVTQLRLAVSRLAPTNALAAEALKGVLDFEVAYAPGEKISELDYLRKKCLNKPRRPLDFRRPGEDPLSIPDVEDVKVYVLGPPHDEAAIRTLTRKKEIYPELVALDATTAFFMALQEDPSRLSREDEAAYRRSFPFGSSYNNLKYEDFKEKDKKIDPELMKFFRANYGFDSNSGEGPEWRRIDDSWLDTASDLALRINNMTNNTSLVLAFEMTTSRSVLLFVGDAQVGNWLSWQNTDFRIGASDQEIVHGEDLLKKTVFYKVGHHGSNNATLRQKGLEMLDGSELIAMIPVDEEWAYTVKHWEHPAKKLLERLEERSSNRVLRPDKIASMPGALEKPDTLDERDWQSFLNGASWDESPDRLWIQYKIK